MTLRTRFDNFSVRDSIIALAALAVVLLASLLSPTYQSAVQAVPKTTIFDGQTVPMSDTLLYKMIIARVSAGENYYDAMASEHRRHGYPLKPFVTVRPPTLAWINASLGPTLTLGLFGLIILATWFSWLPLIQPMNRIGFEGYLVFTTIAVSALILIAPPFHFFHESWAAPLIAISLAVWVQGRIALSIATGVLAVLIRDLAMPYLVLMAVLAAYERRGSEAKSWSCSIGIVGLAYALHGLKVSALLVPGDITSPSWSGLGGWPYLIDTVTGTSLLLFLPEWAIRLVVPLSIFGWMTCRSGLGLRIAGLMLGYALALMLFARDANMYWGILIMPFVLAGVAFAPAGLLALWNGCQRPKSRIDFAAS
jgi:hypothetical protein